MRLGSIVLAAALVVGLLPGASAARVPGASSSVSVLGITESPGVIYEQDALTVALQVANPASVQFMYFTFCELTSPFLCFNPVVMTSQGSGWFQGSTKAMWSYDGMSVGKTAGFNITIEDSAGVNVTLPTTAHQFNLTTTLSVSNFLEFMVAVSDHVYGLSGHILDGSSHAPIVGARVAVNALGSPAPVITGADGAYVFPGLSNGSYTLSVAKAGYRTSNTTVTISGLNATHDVTLTNATSPSVPATRPFLSTTNGQLTVGIVAVAAVIAALAAVLAVRHRRASVRAPAKVAAEPPGPPGPPNA